MMKINYSIADRDTVAKPTGEFLLAVNWGECLVTSGALLASIGFRLSPFKDIDFQPVAIRLSASKKHQQLDLRRAKMAVVTDGRYCLGAGKARTVKPGYGCRFRSELTGTTAYSHY